MPINDLACKNAKPKAHPYRLTDAGGLYLLVQVNGSRLWRLDYRLNGIRKTSALGIYPAVTLAAARSERERIKDLVKAGHNPSLKSAITFNEAARGWFEANRAKWKTSYSARFWSRIEDDILPTIGHRALTSIEPPEILALLRNIENRDAIYTAKRICQMCNTIYRYAIAEGHTRFNPAADLMVALKPLPKREHRAALTESELPEFFRRLRAYRGDEATVLGLKLVAHTFVRTNEIRFAKWDEFTDDLWRIEGDRMKMGKTHLIPLSRQAQQIVARLRVLAGDSEWVMPGRDSKRKPVSENAMLFSLRNMGYLGVATVHGFRSTASTILNESGKFNYDWIERQLAHVPKDQVRSAYNAAQYLEQRRGMMQWYSDLLTSKDGDLSDLLG